MTDDRSGLAHLAADIVDVDLDELQQETDGTTELARRLLAEFQKNE